MAGSSVPLENETAGVGVDEEEDENDILSPLAADLGRQARIAERPRSVVVAVVANCVLQASCAMQAVRKSL